MHEVELKEKGLNLWTEAKRKMILNVTTKYIYYAD